MPAAIGSDRLGRETGDGLTLQCSVAKGWKPRRPADPVVGLAGGSIAPLPEPPFPLAIYLFGESALRLSIVATQSRPAGSLPGTLAYEVGAGVFRMIRRVSVPGS